MTNKQFHDAVLQENSLPVEMVRAVLTDQKLPKNYKTSWKFYREPASPGNSHKATPVKSR